MHSLSILDLFKICSKNKPISFIVPYGPGTGNDIIARLISQKVGENWGRHSHSVNYL